MVAIRMARAGGKKSPYYRVVVTNSRNPRDGRFIEHIGVYDPNRTPVEVRFNQPRLDYWLSKGARPSDTIRELIGRQKKAAAAAAK
jgi:small subunit ribosomal protein S16